MRKLVTAAVGGLLLLSLAGCSAGVPHLTSKSDDKAAAANGAPAKTGKVGTRANPAPAGSTVTVNDVGGDPEYKVTIGKVTTNADAAIHKANMFNSKPPKGDHYIVISATFQYIGADKGTPFADLEIDYVSTAGHTFKSSDSAVVVSHDVDNINDLYTGAKATGNTAIAVPAAEIPNGAIAVSSLFGDPFFIKAS